VAALALVLQAQPAFCFVVHQAVTVRAAIVDFYAGHLVLDARGGATLDDGVLHVAADRIIVDLTNDRYVASGNVTISEVGTLHAVALGVDLSTRRGEAVAIEPAPSRYAIEGASFQPAGAASGASEPLALPDLNGEAAFARAGQAVAHLGADVRLTDAHVLVPGGKDVPLPSYVYMFSSDPGYAASNVASSGEEVPIYFGSTRSSVDGAHFEYNPVTKVALGLDHRIVDGSKAYDLFSVSPLFGPSRNADFTWQEQINSHASQTLSGASSTGVGSNWNYSLSDGVHRSTFQLQGASGLFSNSATLSWQGQYEPLGGGWVGALLNYHLRSEYGRLQSYANDPQAVYHTALEAGLSTLPIAYGTSSSLSLSADWRTTFYSPQSIFPERELAVDYGAQLQHRWNSMLSTSLSDDELPLVDLYPSIGFGTRSYLSRQIVQIYYNHGDPFSLSLGAIHQAAASVPAGVSVEPWSASLDVRFRVNPSLSLDVSRSYAFGYGGQRFSSLGFQILP